MKKTLFLIRKAAPLQCIWMATGDAKRPLECIWVRQETRRIAPAAPVFSHAGGMHQCA
ncbi:MAG: hypothetical protein WCE75_02350 [Terracidiphilus sp.]